MPGRIFISHAFAEDSVANALCGLLEADGNVTCWVAPRDIQAGRDWVDAIPDGMRDADLVLVLLSPQVHQSRYVDRELNLAVNRGQPILPVLLGDFTVSERYEFLLGTIQRTKLPARPSKADLNELARQARSLLADPGRVRDLISEAEPANAPRIADPFLTERVSSANPAYFVVLLDHSWSMNLPMPGTAIKRRDAVADVINEMLYKLLQASLKGDGYQHYFDLSVLGYGLGPDRQGVVSRLPDHLDCIAVEQLYERWLRLREVEQEDRRPDGTVKTVTNQLPIWVESVPCHGRTVMAKGFRRAIELVEAWIEQHPNSLPPVVMNITDGQWTDENPLTTVRELQEKATALGPTLVFNCQLGTSDATLREQLLYPNEVPASYDRRTHELFALSSVLPVSMREEARARGLDVDEDARGLVYNAPVSRVVDFLQVGTQTQI